MAIRKGHITVLRHVGLAFSLIHVVHLSVHMYCQAQISIWIIFSFFTEPLSSYAYLLRVARVVPGLRLLGHAEGLTIHVDGQAKVAVRVTCFFLWRLLRILLVKMA